MQDKMVKELSYALMPQLMKSLKRVKKDKNSFVHYTSSPVALSIIENKCVWMRLTSEMNDLSEVKYGLDCIFGAIHNQKYRHALQLTMNSLYINLYEEFLQEFNRLTPELEANSYITCISEHLEHENEIGRLSMWRAYGTKYDSVALILNPETLMSESSALNAYSTPVSYISQLEFNKILGEISLGISQYNHYLCNFSREECLNLFLRVFALLALTIKHPGFAEEREWRIVTLPRLMGTQGLEASVATIQKKEQPIYKIPLKNVPEKGFLGAEVSQLITGIIIGPSKFQEKTAKKLVNALRKSGSEDSEAIRKVVLSNIPLRCE